MKMTILHQVSAWLEEVQDYTRRSAGNHISKDLVDTWFVDWYPESHRKVKCSSKEVLSLSYSVLSTLESTNLEVCHSSSTPSWGCLSFRIKSSPLASRLVQSPKVVVMIECTLLGGRELPY